MLARAGSPFNCDWDATKNSVHALAKLRPTVIGAGHGIPIEPTETWRNGCKILLARFRRPRHGRYVHESAVTDENGVVSLPPAPFDPVPFATAASLLLAGIALGAGAFDDKTR